MNKVDEMQRLVNEIVINITEKDGQAVVSSRDIAEKFEKNHKEVLRSIDNQIEVLGGAQNCAGLFIESQYQHPQNKQWYKEYLLTRDGFSFVAMSFTGEKAAKWKLKYIEAFNKMEALIKESTNPYQGMSKELQAILLVDKKQQANEKRITEVAEDLKDFKENAPLFNVECDELQKALKKKLVHLLGGKQSPAYRDNSIRQKAFIDAQHQIKREFAVSSYKGIKRVHFEKALEIIENYTLPTALQEVVTALNSQVSIQAMMLEKDNLIRGAFRK